MHGALSLLCGSITPIHPRKVPDPGRGLRGWSVPALLGSFVFGGQSRQIELHGQCLRATNSI